MAYTTIDNPELYFQTKLYSGNGSNGHAITFDGSENMSPDWVWIKSRSSNSHRLTDSVRGATKVLYSDLTFAEATDADTIQSFDTNGFTIDDDADTNGSGQNFASWNWKAGGSASSNGNGSITSTVSANTTAGFSIVSWTGSGASATIGHGLSSAPELVIVKNRTDSSTDWRIGNTVVSGKTMADDNGYYLEFDTGAIANPGGKTIWGSGPSAPTSTVFSVGSNNSNNGSSDNMIAYCFHSVKGYSKIGSYIPDGGGSDNTFIYTGFRPSWIISKGSSFASAWTMTDSKRSTFNVVNSQLFAQTTGAEDNSSTNLMCDYLSNGFKIRSNNAAMGSSGNTYIFMAFAESPFVNSKGVPTNAR